MKNVIPLVVAVILGLSAVYLVSHALVKNESSGREDEVAVVIAARDLVPGDEINPGACSFKKIPRSAQPRGALLWDNVSLIYGQTVPVRISQGDFIEMSDLQLNVSLADCVAKGLWLVPVTFSDPTLVKMLMPEDEIAIVASRAEAVLTPGKAKGTGDPNVVVQAPVKELELANISVSQQRETTVLFPCVKVIGIAGENGAFLNRGGSASSTIFVALPPRQATMLLAAQRESELYPVLRRRNDPSAMNRREIGVVNAATFVKMRTGLEPVEVPDGAASNDK